LPERCCSRSEVRFALQEDGGVVEDEGDGVFDAGDGIAEGVMSRMKGGR